MGHFQVKHLRLSTMDQMEQLSQRFQIPATTLSIGVMDR